MTIKISAGKVDDIELEKYLIKKYKYPYSLIITILNYIAYTTNSYMIGNDTIVCKIKVNDIVMNIFLYLKTKKMEVLICQGNYDFVNNINSVLVYQNHINSRPFKDMRVLLDNLLIDLYKLM